MIVKDGLSVWSKVHESHPDIRHGQEMPTPLNEEEAYYWITRLLSWIQYMARRKHSPVSG